MEIIFIRHGEPDKAEVDRRGVIGLGRELAPLTGVGIRQAGEAAENPLLEGSQLIVSSPYTRALFHETQDWRSVWRLTFMNLSRIRHFR